MKKTETLIAVLNKSIIGDNLLGKTGKIIQRIKTKDHTYIDVDIVDYGLIKLSDLNDDHSDRLEGSTIVFGTEVTEEGFVSTVITLSPKAKKTDNKKKPTPAPRATNSPTHLPTSRYF